MDAAAREALVDERLASPGLPNPFTALYRSSSVSPVKKEAHTTTILPPPDKDTEVERKRRRVTFSAIEEQTYVLGADLVRLSRMSRRCGFVRR